MELQGKLVTDASAKDREEEVAKLKALSVKRFGGVG